MGYRKTSKSNYKKPRLSPKCTPAKPCLPKPSLMPIIQRGVKPSSSFFRVADQSWVNLFTQVDSETGIRSGVIYSGKLTDEATPTLAKLVQEEMERRKLDFVKAIHSNAEDRSGKKPNAQRIVILTTPIKHDVKVKQLPDVSIKGKGVTFKLDSSSYKHEGYSTDAFEFNGGYARALVKLDFHTMRTHLDEKTGKWKHYWDVGLEFCYSGDNRGGYCTPYVLSETGLSRKEAREFATKWMKTLSMSEMVKKLDPFYQKEIAKSKKKIW